MPEGAGSRGPQGLPARCPAHDRRSLGGAISFGSYNAKRVRSVCLHNYSDFLLSETVECVTPP
ncbi:hypothetical protein GCM10023220_59810 [Streptomyces ziwulingensis]|uniref:Uncharacterized protein n=1 Tax=Streptomyces ziwulingensis TaxID=1045501 RepID=A0ABP9D0G6_9ACTN